MQPIKVYRVTDLVKSLNYRALIMEVAMKEGTRIHKLLAEQKKQLFPTHHIEEPLVTLLTTKKKGKVPILGLLLGTPDEWWIEGNTLYVVDWKTISEKDKVTLKDWWLDQTSLYALKASINTTIPIKYIVYGVHVYIRREKTVTTIINGEKRSKTVTDDEATLKDPLIYSYKMTLKELRTRLLPWLTKLLGYSYILVPLSRGQIINEESKP